jgi:hypothetical protein
MHYLSEAHSTTVSCDRCAASRLFPIESVDILGPGISEYERRIVWIET